MDKVRLIGRGNLRTAGSSGIATGMQGGARRGEGWSNRGGVGRGSIDRCKEGGGSGPFSGCGRRGDEGQRRGG